MICRKCAKNLDAFFELRRRASVAERQYFQLLRNVEKFSEKIAENSERTKQNSKRSKTDHVEKSEENSASSKCRNMSTSTECCQLKQVSTMIDKLQVNQQKRLNGSNDFVPQNLSAENVDKRVRGTNDRFAFQVPVTKARKFYKCSFCGKKYERLSYLFRHKASKHEDENCSNFRPARAKKRVAKVRVKCIQCSQRFVSERGMKRHCREVHLGKKNINIIGNVTTYLFSIFSDLRPYKCWCGLTYKRNEKLMYHQQSLHNGHDSPALQ